MYMFYPKPSAAVELPLVYVPQPVYGDDYTGDVIHHLPQCAVQGDSVACDCVYLSMSLHAYIIEALSVF